MDPNQTRQPSGSPPQPVDVLGLVISKLEALNIPYMIGGSFASSVYGFARSTQDADLIVKLEPNQVDGFVERFRGEFYADRALIEQAVERSSSFNVIHLKSMFKVDFFILRNRPFSQEEFSRRTRRQLYADAGLEGYWQSPEDTVLSKLEWYRTGGEASDSQWRDVTGILKNRRRQLDMLYLNRWACELHLEDLLEEALKEATE